MIFQYILLFVSAWIGSVAVLVMRAPSPVFLQRLLIFAGGYLFSITVLHLLPDLFSLHADTRLVGLYILTGFFLQLFLELFSKGVEHGHMYDTSQEVHQHNISPHTLMIALFIHALLDGIILSSPSTTHAHHTHGTHGLLIGILLHKMPVSFALASILSKLIRNPRIVIAYLAIFSLASPLGLWISNYYSQQQLLSGHGTLALWGIVSGSFLHIATTIFFEANPSHQPNTHKFIMSLIGAGLAAVCEFAG